MSDNVEMVKAFLRAQNMEQVGRLEQAIDLYEGTVRGAFDSTGPYDRLIALYSNAGRHADVIRVAEAALTNVHTYDDKKAWYERMRHDAQSAMERAVPQRHAQEAGAVTELLDRIIREVRDDGPLPFDRYMDMCLYDPDAGYYSAGPQRTSTRGDYVTSPELDPAFGALWCAGFEEVWRSSDRPERFSIVEIGPGEGAFAEAVMEAASADFRRALAYELVEPLDELARRQKERLGTENFSWTGRVAGARQHGIVFANEVIDNLPVALVEGTDNGVVEICVGVSDNGLAEQRRPARSEVLEVVSRFKIQPALGERAEVPLAAAAFVHAAIGTVEMGAIVFIDYGYRTAELLTRPGGTIVTYSSQGAGADPLVAPGQRDITAHANWDVVEGHVTEAGATVAGLVRQGDALRALGAEDLLSDLRRQERVASANGDGRAALRAISRRGALSTLLSGRGLGGLGVLTVVKGIDHPSWT